MSDLTGSRPVITGYGRASNNGGTIAQTGPVPVGSPSNATGIKGPREIMRERALRDAQKEAQRRADQEAKEALERRRAEDEQKLVDMENKRNAERRATNTSVAGARRGNNTGTAPASGLSEQTHRSDVRGTNITKPSGFVPSSTTQARAPGRPTVTEETMGNSHAREPSGNPLRQARNQEIPKTSTTARAEPGPAIPPSEPNLPQPETASSSRRVTRSSFPHAFERWETLSAHWEGLTSYWVRRLDENKNELDKEPLSRQMSRQITDLSAAGANLFHAVVELQRLRASSERKFQRWYFESKQLEKENQRAREMLEKALFDERNNRARAIEDAVAVALAVEKDKSNSDKKMMEMRRELNIAREEARRAWEELGRREQEERDRTISLRDGLPTLVGGVQVVPMMQGVTSRRSSARDQPPPGNQRPVSGQYTGGQQPNTGDPFTEPSRPATSSTRGGNLGTYAQYPSTSAAQGPSSTAPFYQQHQGTVQHTEDPTGREQYNRSFDLSEPYSEEEYIIDSHGQYRRDSGGNKIKFPGGPSSDTMEEEYGDPEETEHGQSAEPAEETEYSGEGYGTDWEALRTHHHPTRLSDVLEEDERSRASASQLS